MKCDDVFHCFPLFQRLGQSNDSLGGNVESDGEYLLTENENAPPTFEFVPTPGYMSWGAMKNIGGAHEVVMSIPGPQQIYYQWRKIV
jgi:hypothetical protein